MITFLSIGDFGAKTPIQEQVIQQIHQFKNHTSVDAILSLGDNFYNYGVHSVESPRWAEFEKSFQLWCPFYAILGNHDYLGNTQAQIAYSLKPSTFWKMPSRYYDKKFFTSKEKMSVHVFFLDTFTLCPNESRNCSVAMGMEDFDDLYANKDWSQYRWLERKLSTCQCQWKIVVGHYPVFSNGLHGNTEELVDDLLPLLKRYTVDFYLSGHDHDLEVIRKEDITFIVSGTGCSSNPVQSCRDSLYSSNPMSWGVSFLQFTQNYSRFGIITNQGEKMWYSLPKQKNVRYKKE